MDHVNELAEGSGTPLGSTPCFTANADQVEKVPFTVERKMQLQAECPVDERDDSCTALDADQLDILRLASSKRLLEIVGDLTDRDSPRMSESLFLLGMHPVFQRANATPETVRLACLDLLRDR